MIEPKWISGRKLIDERWHLEPAELIDFVVKGLQPYDKLRRSPKNPPGVTEIQEIIRSREKMIMEIDTRFPEIKNRDSDEVQYLSTRRSEWTPDLFQKLKKQGYSDGSNDFILLDYLVLNEIVSANYEKLEQYNNLPSWEGYSPAALNTNETNLIISDLMDSLYLIKDIEHFEQTENMGVASIDKLDNDVELRGKINKEIATKHTSENFLRRNGNIWSIKFEGKEYNFIDYKYISYLALIVQQNGKPVKCINLVRALSGNEIECIPEGRALDEGLSIGHTYKDDEVTEKQIERFSYINNKLEQETNPLIRKEYEDERDKLEDYFRNMNRVEDKDGRPARRGKIVRKDAPFEKTAQSNIKKALERAYDAFSKENAKELKNHFSKAIRPAGDYDYEYYSQPKILWEVIWE